MMHRYAVLLCSVLAFPFIAGCNTYLQEKADVVSGGPERREQAAQERLDAAQDSESGLKTDLEVLAEERALQDKKLADLSQRREAQEARIARARAENKISRAAEEALRDRVASLDREIHDVEFRLQAARTSADTEQEEALRNQLAELEDKAGALDEEIDLLSQ